MTIKENFDTDSGTINAGGARTITRSFYVFPFDTFADADAAMANTDADGVAIDDEYTLGGVTATYYGTRSWSRVDGSGDTWVFNLEYTTATSDSGDTNVDIQTQGDSRGTTKSVYRVVSSDGWAAGNDTSGWNNPTRSDIGGIPVDSGGTSTSIIAVDRRFETTELNDEFPTLGALSNLVGTRNLHSHDGGEAGTILYTGFGWNLDTNSGMWQIKHTFAVDKLTFHAEQVAKTNAQGEVLTTKFGKDPLEYFSASHVFWIQPFPITNWGDNIPEFS